MGAKFWNRVCPMIPREASRPWGALTGAGLAPMERSYGDGIKALELAPMGRSYMGWVQFGPNECGPGIDSLKQLPPPGTAT